ncbi:hypothetical protein B0H42_002979 [Clostridium saccharobutylicum]|nr:hypothetical protein [Clostridium saccharobutylicum]
MNIFKKKSVDKIMEGVQKTDLKKILKLKI